MPDVKEVTIKDNGKVEIGPMTYTKPGRYNYFISQEAGNAEHFTYDSAVYTVTSFQFYTHKAVQINICSGKWSYGKNR